MWSSCPKSVPGSRTVVIWTRLLNAKSDSHSERVRFLATVDDVTPVSRARCVGVPCSVFVVVVVVGLLFLEHEARLGTGKARFCLHIWCGPLNGTSVGNPAQTKERNGELAQRCKGTERVAWVQLLFLALL